MVKKKFEWKKFALGLKRPAITLLGMGIAYLIGVDGFVWLGASGVTAERIWSTIEFFLKR